METNLNKQVNRTGRPSDYSEVTAAEICSRMIEGESLLKICADDDMPARVTIYRWLEKHAAFRDRYARAREAQAHYYFELIRDIAFDDKDDFFIENGKVVADHARVQRARLKVDSLKWTSSKLLPRVYGDKPAEEPSAAASETKWIGRVERVIVAPKNPEPSPPEPPRQIEYHPQQPPADLSAEAWSAIARVSELIEQIAPGDEKPESVFGLIEGFLRKHYLADRS
jgi:hypothetical protein